MTRIEWTEETWNPTVGCSRVSSGCDHCYAVGQAHRQQRTGAYAGTTTRVEIGGRARTGWTGVVNCLPDRLDVPLRRRKPTTWFVDSMSDLFHPGVPIEFLEQVWAVMGRSPWHTFQVLTKRPRRMRRILTEGHVYWADPMFDSIEWASSEYPVIGEDRWLPNVWLGTSIESDCYTRRADPLRATPAAIRFLSLEPLLGPLPSLDLTGIDWVIVGGESGPGARPMHPDWVRGIRDRCVAADVPFFFKQAGAVLASEWGMSDRKGHLLNEMPADLRIREMPDV